MLIRHGAKEEWHEPENRGFISEGLLQRMLMHSPDLLPGFEQPLVATAIELPVPVGAGTGWIDILCIDRSGAIAIVECKLDKAADVKKKVIGQVLSYAAGLSTYTFAGLDAAFARSMEPKVPLTDLFHTFVELNDEETVPMLDEEQFRGAVETNLREGRFTLVVAVDEINDELRGIVEFLNKRSAPDLVVLALELTHFEDQGVEILLPHVYGIELAAAKRPPTGKHAWTPEEFQAHLEELGSPGADAFGVLVDAIEELGGELNPAPTATPHLRWRMGVEGHDVVVCGVYEDSAFPPKFFVDFHSLASAGISHERLDRLAADLMPVPGMAEKLADLKAKDYKKTPGALVDELGDPGVVETVAEALRRLVNTGDQLSEQD